MTFEFDTSDFRFTHGKEPRGFGSWAFTFEGREPVWAPASSFADAKKWVRDLAKQMMPGNAGSVTIKVCT